MVAKKDKVLNEKDIEKVIKNSLTKLYILSELYKKTNKNKIKKLINELKKHLLEN